MGKGKLGLDFRFYAILAFVLAFIGQTTLLGLLLGLVLVVEREEWTSRQCMQAFFLAFAGSVLDAVVFAIRSVVGVIPFVGTALSSVLSFISGIISVVVMVMAFVGFLNVMRGKEAGLPLFSGWANRAFGIIPTPPPAPAAPAGQPAPPYAQPAAPAGQQQPAAPYTQPAAPTGQPAAAPYGQPTAPAGQPAAPYAQPTAPAAPAAPPASPGENPQQGQQ